MALSNIIAMTRSVFVDGMGFSSKNLGGLSEGPAQSNHLDGSEAEQTERTEVICPENPPLSCLLMRKMRTKLLMAW